MCEDMERRHRSELQELRESYEGWRSCVICTAALCVFVNVCTLNLYHWLYVVLQAVTTAFNCFSVRVFIRWWNLLSNPALPAFA